MARHLKPYFMDGDVLLYNPLTMERALCDKECYAALSAGKLPKSMARKLAPVLTPEKESRRWLESNCPRKPAISVMYALLTDECNYACRYCFIEEAMRPHKPLYMSKKTAKRMIDFSRTCATKKPTIIFYGGEPLLNKEIFRYMVEGIRRTDLADGRETTLQVVTNGSLVDRATAKFMRKHGVAVGVSIDGPKEVHDAMRVMKHGRTGSFDKTIRGWNILKGEGCKPGVSCTIGVHNVDRLPEITEWFCTELGASGVGFNVLAALPGKRNPAHVSPELVTRKLIESFKVVKKHNVPEDRVYRRRVKSFINKHFWLKDCAACGNEMAVAPDGQVGPCHGFVSSRLYFIPEIPKSEKELVNHPIWQEWLNRFPLKMNACRNCAAIGICGGGCPYYSHIVHGSIHKIDERACTLCSGVLNWVVGETYGKLRKPVDVMYRVPNMGDEERFMAFRNALLAEDVPMGMTALDMRFPSAMQNITAAGTGACLFAEAGGEIIGFANMLWGAGHDSRTGSLGVAVRGDWRRKGVASRLIELVLNEARAAGVKVARLGAYSNNPAIALYRKLGFREVGRVPRAVKHKERIVDDVIMAKEL